jgi:hypothetical protein
MTTSAITTDVERLKARLKMIWMAGDYDIFSRYLEDSAREFYKRLPLHQVAHYSMSGAVPASWL